FGPCWRHQRPRYRRDLAFSCSAASRLLVSSKRTTSALFTGRPVSFASLSAYLSSRLSSASSSLKAVIFFESAIIDLGRCSECAVPEPARRSGQSATGSPVPPVRALWLVATDLASEAVALPREVPAQQDEPGVAPHTMQVGTHRARHRRCTRPGLLCAGEQPT